MKVELLSHTPDALNLLLRTKNTRLGFNADPSTWPQEKRAEHLSYMRDTIKSSWEFVDFVFKIEGVTRAFTHQLVRTRQGSYAQESQRTVDVRTSDVEKPDTIAENAGASAIWDTAQKSMLGAYGFFLDHEIPTHDARGILPTNITTSIVAKYNLRTLSEMGQLRLCTRTQGEYQEVFREMRRLVIEAEPWAADFIDVYCAVHGTCAFPRYGRRECPFFRYTVHDMAMEAGANTHKVFWESKMHQATPKAKGGMSV